MRRRATVLQVAIYMNLGTIKAKKCSFLLQRNGAWPVQRRPRITIGTLRSEDATTAKKSLKK